MDTELQVAKYIFKQSVHQFRTCQYVPESERRSECIRNSMEGIKLYFSLYDKYKNQLSYGNDMSLDDFLKY